MGIKFFKNGHIGLNKINKLSATACSNILLTNSLISKVNTVKEKNNGLSENAELVRTVENIKPVKPVENIRPVENVEAAKSTEGNEQSTEKVEEYYPRRRGRRSYKNIESSEE